MPDVGGAGHRWQELGRDGATVASHRGKARVRAKGMDGMSRTSTTVGRRQSIPAWMTAAAVVAVLALALVWRAAPAMADTAPAATPTVAPTTAAAVATATPVASNSVQTRAVAPGTGDQCATPDASFG
ncbi:MAG: hypothetical protein EBS89_12525, partial [Proteobacteria bacterium]|nr:hypothetical protein [Pseudomonadota bacterium]